MAAGQTRAVDEETVTQMRRLRAEGGARKVEQRFGAGSLQSPEYKEAMRRRAQMAARQREARREAAEKQSAEQARPSRGTRGGASALGGRTATQVGAGPSSAARSGASPNTGTASATRAKATPQAAGSTRRRIVASQKRRTAGNDGLSL